MAQMVKNLPAIQETCVWSLGWEDPLEKEMETHSSILAWKILWTEEPGRLQSMGMQRVRHDWATNTSTSNESWTVKKAELWRTDAFELCCWRRLLRVLWIGRRSNQSVLKESENEVTQSCPTLCDPMDCSLSGSSIHGIFQARVLEWIVISFSRGSSQSRNRTWVSCIAGRCFTIWATREAHPKGSQS